MSLLDGFLRDIIDHPDDDTPRLSLADWLTDQGTPYGPASGELIRVQCRLAALPRDAEERPSLEAKQLLLLQGPAQHWATRYRRIVRDWTFHRGLLGEVSSNSSLLVANAGPLFRSLPLQRLTLLDIENQVEKVAVLPELARLRGLTVRGFGSHYGVINQQRLDQAMTALVDSPHLTGLRELAPALPRCCNHKTQPDSLSFLASKIFATETCGCLGS